MRFFFYFLCLLSSIGFTTPSQIIIIRHGEKLPNNPNLSPKGIERALALSVFFQTDPFVTKLGPPKALLSYKPEAPDYSRRGPETMDPLSQALSLKVERKFDGEEYDLLAKDVLENSKYDNIPILICWMHGKIPNLLESLGFSNIPNYPGDEFDLIFRISYETKNKPKLCIGLQRLLYGDQSQLPEAFTPWECK